jgi:hypothetical protein
MRSLQPAGPGVRLSALLLAVAVRFSAAMEAQTLVQPWMFLGSKQPYWPQMMGAAVREEMPAHCKLVHVNHLARHGSRHATKLKDASRTLASLQRAEATGELTQKGKEALQWISEYIATETAMIGALRKKTEPNRFPTDRPPDPAFHPQAT